MKEFNNDYTLRFRPDFRYCKDKLGKIGLKNFESKDPSSTDKEAYRMTLATLRGELAESTGARDVGSYSLKPGEEYDPNFDFSFINRKDVTLVEIDDFIENFKSRADTYSEELKNQIELELAQKRESLERETKDKNSSGES